METQGKPDEDAVRIRIHVAGQMTGTGLSDDRTDGIGPPLWAGLSLAQPRVMGILNVTPDSFSDGGRHTGPDAAIRAGLQLVQDGADIVDVGGESTRPGAAAITPAQEQARIIPVIQALAAAGVVVSADTRQAATMRAALDAGARIINDVSGLRHDPTAPALVAERACPVVLMHMRGTPATMNSLARYQDVVREVVAELAACLSAADAAGIERRRIVLDPGIGFAKHEAHSVAILRGLPALHALGCPILVGLSRKSFIGRISGEADASRRLGGSIAGALFALSRGASLLRVHDVRETVQAIRVWQALSRSGTVSLP